MYNVAKFMSSALCRVFTKDYRSDGIHVAEAIDMIQSVKRIATGVKKMNQRTRLAADDCEHCDEYVAKCMNALKLYNENVDIDCISEQYGVLQRQMNANMVQNCPLIEMLSFRIHLLTDISYWYVQRYILAKLYPDSKYSVYGSNFSYIHSNENTSMANMLIQLEMDDENRFVPLPQVSTLESREISHLQYCVLRIEELCLELPEDIQEFVRSERRPVNFIINPNTRVFCEFDEASGTIRCNGATSLVELAHDDCGIKIDLESAFWIHCKLGYEFKDWSILLDEGFNSYLRDELKKFPEIDQNIIIKVQAMMRHPASANKFRE
jgi:ferredoxin